MLCKNVCLRFYGPTDVYDIPSEADKSRTSIGGNGITEIETSAEVYYGYSLSMVNFDMVSDMGDSEMPVHKGKLVRIIPLKDEPYEIEVDGKTSYYPFIGTITVSNK
jgi:hypothetical protein